MQTCGHGSFYFDCVKSLDSYPICNEQITSWKCVKTMVPFTPTKSFALFLFDAFEDTPLL